MEKKCKDCPNKEDCNCFSQVKQEQLNRQPVLETRISKSEDGKWIIHKTIITDIKPTDYFQKVVN